MKSYYPVFLDLQGKPCKVFGGGAVAEGKVAGLQDAGADVTVISPEATAGIRAAARQGLLRWLAREYRRGDLSGAYLGIAATNVREVNRRIFREAQDLSVPLNVVDDPAQCTFISPSVVTRGVVTVAISTGGVSPALARKIRESLQDSPALQWADLAAVLSRARSQVKQRGAAVDPQRWQCCLTPKLLAMAQAGLEEESLDLLLSNLLDYGAPGLCPRVAQCDPGGCAGKDRSDD